MEAARRSTTLDATVATGARQESVDVEISDLRANPPRQFRMTGRVQNVFPLPASQGGGIQLVRAFPSKGSLKTEENLHFGERVSIFLDWAMLRLQTARAGADLAPVRPTLLVKGSETPWQAGLTGWDEALLDASAGRRSDMLDDLHSRVAQLVYWWHDAQRAPHWYFARTSWKAASLPGNEVLTTAELATIQGAWSAYGGGGEKFFAPGFNRLVAGDVEFDRNPPQLTALVEFAEELLKTISLSGLAHA